MSAARKAQRAFAMRQDKATVGHLRDLQHLEDRRIIAAKEAEIAFLVQALKDIQTLNKTQAERIKRLEYDLGIKDEASQ